MPYENVIYRYSPTSNKILYTSGFYRNVKLDKHTHKEIGVGYTLYGGQKSFRISGTVDLPPDRGSVMVINHDEVHNGYSTSEDGWVYEGLYIPIDCFVDLNKELLGKSQIPYFRYPIIKDEKLFNLIRKVINLFLHTSVVDCEIIEQCESEIISYLIEHYSDSRKHISWVNKGKVHIAREAILDDPLADYDLNQLAELSKLNPSYFVRAFKNEFGMTPYSYLLQHRIGMSKVLLAQGTPPSEVASMCKFYDQSHFYKYFKKYFGITPGDFQKGAIRKKL